MRFIWTLCLCLITLFSVGCLQAPADYSGVDRRPPSVAPPPVNPQSVPDTACHDRQVRVRLIVQLADKDGDGYLALGELEDACQTMTASDQMLCVVIVNSVTSYSGDPCVDEVVATIGLTLRGGDCNDNDVTVYSGAPELCDGKDNNCDGTRDEGLVGCVACWSDVDCSATDHCVNATPTVAGACQAVNCNDNDACTVDPAPVNHGCAASVYTAGCCNPLHACAGGFCTSQTNASTGTCQLCRDNADCADNAACNMATHICATVICPDDGDACTAVVVATNHACPAPTVTAGCCNPLHACIGLTCTSTVNATAGTCVGCTVDANCAGTERCNLASHVCEAVPCPADGNACTNDVVVNHACTYPPVAIPGSACCQSATDDAACTASRPVGLPAGYVWGCSTATVLVAPGQNLFICTSCSDVDGDGICLVSEICGNGRDDNGNGLIDETPCVPQPPANPACVRDIDCAVVSYCFGGQCYVRTDLHGSTGSGQSGINGGPFPDGTSDAIDNDGDCFCETAPCVGSVNPTCTTILGGDCDDSPDDSPDVNRSRACFDGVTIEFVTFLSSCPADHPVTAFTTDGSIGNHPGVVDVIDNYDNDCNGSWQ